MVTVDDLRDEDLCVLVLHKVSAVNESGPGSGAYTGERVTLAKEARGLLDALIERLEQEFADAREDLKLLAQARNQKGI